MDAPHVPDPSAALESLETLSGLKRLRLALEGAPAFLVGGAVRDLLLGVTPAELDIAVEGDVAPVAERLGGQIRTHERFSTATADLDGARIDLARTRAEAYSHPGALPDVEPAPLAEDLQRRDFTINAMAIPLQGEPELLDPCGGLADLGAGILRVLHEASFTDDPTRGLRAARYAARLGLEPEPRTAELLPGTDFSTISADRVAAELRLIALEPTAPRALRLLDQWGVLPAGPETLELVDAVDGFCGRDPWPGLADRAASLLIAYGCDGAGNQPAGPRSPALTAADALVAAQPQAPFEAVVLARARSGEELVVARALGAEWLDDYASKWRAVTLQIDGADLIEAGVAEGPDVGRGLDAALAAKLVGRAEGREQELEIALAAARSG